VDRDSAKQAFRQFHLVLPLRRHVPQHAYGLASDFSSNAVTRQNENV
jgi:hypothetical protein